MKDETGKDIIGVATKEIKIDMEKPIISEIKYDKIAAKRLFNFKGSV